MALRKGLPAKLALTDADDTRYDFRNLVVCNADGSPRGGVTSPVGVSLVSSTATMNVSVGAFSAIAARDGGAILLANDGPTNVLLPAAPASNSRIDVIWAKQNDASSTVVVPDANNNALLSSTQGTAAATPTKPAIPTGAVELATVLIPAGATATNSSSPAVVITQTAQFVAAPGGKVPFRTFSDLQAWTTATTGQTARVFADSTTAKNGDYVYSGSTWLYATPGMVPLTPGGVSFTSATSVSVDQKFGAPFTNYMVHITVRSASANSVLQMRLRASGADAAGSGDYSGSIIQWDTSASGAQTGAISYAQLNNVNSAGGSVMDVEIHDPAVASPTMILSKWSHRETSAAIAVGMNSGAHALSNVYDGFTIYPSSGNVTGVLFVYGLA